MAHQDDADAGSRSARLRLSSAPALRGRERAFALSYWSESAAEKEVLLGALMDFLLPQKYFVVADTGWSKWDLKIARGLWSRALVTVVAENHGAAKRLMRVRCAMRLSGLGRVLLRGYAGLAAASLILGSPASATLAFLAIAIVNLGVIGWHLVTFGRLMHCIVETVARQARLVPAEPLDRPILPLGKARTV